jgi:DNA replication protein DnaC
MQFLDARLSLLLNDLKLPTMRKIYGKVADAISSNGGDFRAFLLALLEEELKERRTRRIARRTKDARFRQVKLFGGVRAKITANL